MSHIAFITGSTRGIGKATALLFASSGHTVIIHGSRRSAAAAKTLAQVQQLSPRSTAAYFDIAQATAVNRATAKLLKQYGKIDILINNAGLNHDRTLLKMSLSQWDQVITTNLTGTFLLTKAVLPHMVKAKYGRIINISSIVAHTGNFGQTNYAAAKAGLIGFTRSLALEVAKHHITVNAVCPGFTSTDMTAAIPPEHSDRIVSNIPLKRFAKPQEIAYVIHFLAQPQNSYMTGSIIDVNGGLF